VTDLNIQNFNRSARYSVLNKYGKFERVLIHGVKYILTINDHGNFEILRDQSLIIENGIIAKLFPKDETKGTVDMNAIDLIYDAEQKGGVMMTPGFFNMHTHPPMYLLRSTLTFTEEDLDLALKGMAEIEGKMNSEQLYLGALGDFTEEQKSGISFSLSHYGVFDEIERAAVECGHWVINCLSAASNSHPKNNPALVAKYLNGKNHHTTPGVALHYVWKADPIVLKEIKKLLDSHDTYFTLHVAETEQTIARCVDKFGERPIAVLEKYGLLGPRTIMSHCIHLTTDEIKLIKQRRVICVHLPTSNLLHRSGQFDFKAFHDENADELITLGTDSVVSKNRLDLLSEALAAKTTHQAHHIVSYEELFDMCTARPARLLGLKNHGRIAVGFHADMAFWKIKDRGLMPYDENKPQTLLTNLITHGSRSVRDLMINGQFIISNRYHNLVDESNLLEKLQAAHMELRKQ